MLRDFTSLHKSTWMHHSAERPGDWTSRIPGNFYHKKLWGNFPTSLSNCPTSPLVTANVPPVLCPFQLRSWTSKINRIMWFTTPSPMSHFGVGPRTRISSVGCFDRFFRRSTAKALLHNDGREVCRTQECPLWSHDRAIVAWYHHQSHYL